MRTRIRRFTATSRTLCAGPARSAAWASIIRAVASGSPRKQVERRVEIAGAQKPTSPMAGPRFPAVGARLRAWRGSLNGGVILMALLIGVMGFYVIYPLVL